MQYVLFIVDCKDTFLGRENKTKKLKTEHMYQLFMRISNFAICITKMKKKNATSGLTI
jgi:hypothetical protein